MSNAGVLAALIGATTLPQPIGIDVDDAAGLSHGAPARGVAALP
jgi:hypothetical protein